MEPTKEELFHAFNSAYRIKYHFEHDTPIGGGANGHVYKAVDIHRSVDVAIKIFINGRPPHGVERGWAITSRIVDPQIAPTSTIEFFSYDGADYVAVVSRFIPGRTIKQLFDWIEYKSASDRALVGEDMAKTLVPSLLEALEKCQRFGYGHGDLHEGNVMTFLTDVGPVFKFQAVLIDFDNASIKTEVHAATEKEKQMADVRLFRSRLGPNIIMDWNWGPFIAAVYQHYDSFKDLRFAHTLILEFIAAIKTRAISAESLHNQLKPLVTHATTGFQPKPLIDTLRTIAAASGNALIFEQAYNLLLRSATNPASWTSSVEITVVNDRKNTLYKEIFG